MISLAAVLGIKPAMSDSDPPCRHRDLTTGAIVESVCDRFQSKGDLDTITPQVRIVEPANGANINYAKLPDANNDGVKELPIKIVVSPEFDLDFAGATNAGTQYGFLPQVDGHGHAHAYIAPVIGVSSRGGRIDAVDFVGNDNRADYVGGFCVFQSVDPAQSTSAYQVVNVSCPLTASREQIEKGEYRVIVDFTDDSHGPRFKSHPRAVPPGDQVVVTFVNTGCAGGPGNSGSNGNRPC